MSERKLLHGIQVHRAQGVTVLALERRDAPLASANIMLPGGVLDARSGPLLRATTDLLAEGPEGTAPMDWHRRLEDAAVDVRLNVYGDHWAAGASSLTEDFEGALDMMAEAAARPSMPKAEWRRIIKSHRASVREAMKQPAHVIHLISSVQALGFDHPNARPASEKAYRKLRYDDAAALGRRAYRNADGAFATVGGDIDPAAMTERVLEIIRSMPRRDEPVPEEPPLRPSAKPVWIMDNRKTTQAFFNLTRPGFGPCEPDRLAMKIADHALGGGFSSRLMRRVRSEMGHTYGIGSRLSPSRLATPFSISSFTTAESLGAMLELVHGIVEEVLQDGLTDEEIAEAREHLHGALPLWLTSPWAILHYAQNDMQNGFSVDEIEADWRGLLDVTADEAHAAARRMLGDGSFRLAVIGPAGLVAPQVARYGEAERFDFRTHPEDWPRP